MRKFVTIVTIHTGRLSLVILKDWEKISIDNFYINYISFLYFFPLVDWTLFVGVPTWKEYLGG
jgi:hypothetical protein